jgi:DNA-binding Xre family transcriptional regulator
VKKARTDYEQFAATPDGRRLLRQEELIFDTTDALGMALENSGMNKVQLAKKLGKTKAFVTQLLGGGRNLTLRTIADVCYALNCRAQIRIIPLDSYESCVIQSYVYRGDSKQLVVQPFATEGMTQMPFTYTFSVIAEERMPYGSRSNDVVIGSGGGVAA